jgi:membrane associated rhomboid family serine protease
VTKLRVSYNAPVVLTLGILAVVVNVLPQSVIVQWFATRPQLQTISDYVCLFSHVLGHASWEHLLGNFTLILLVGPMLEERYGSLRLLGMILVTALITGLLHVLLFSAPLLGASDIAFMMILLASIVNRRGVIPLTFIAVAVIYLGGEIVRVFQPDNVSQFSHVLGGLLGACFGFLGGGSAKATADASASTPSELDGNAGLPHEPPSSAPS